MLKIAEIVFSLHSKVGCFLCDLVAFSIVCSHLSFQPTATVQGLTR